ncbi:MAG: hypothetical protein C0483_21705 [Pirellula sp.]|nr:hypothetical protein [Pirellula sp.]
MLFAGALVAVFAASTVQAADGASPTPAVASFLRTHCLDCHQGAEAEGGLDLAKLGYDLATPEAERRWVRIFDRVHDGEMPPVDSPKPKADETAAFLSTTGDWLRAARHRRDAELGRVQARRLTRREVERSLHDLLGIDVPLADQLPEESRSAGFTTTADGQSISHFQLERHLAVVDMALDEAYRRALGPGDEFDKTFDAAAVARRNPRSRTREPEMLDGKAVVWSSGLTFYGRIPTTTAREQGWYRFAVTLSALKPPESGGVWCTVNTGLCVSSAPLLTYVTSFEATPEPRTFEFEAWLPERHMLEIRPGDKTLKKGKFAGGQVGAGEGSPQDLPGIAIERLTMRRVHHGAQDDATRTLLFGDLVVKRNKDTGERKVLSEGPKKDSAKLLKEMARRAFRRPVTDEEIAGYVAMTHGALAEGQTFTAALRVGYRALLCSPRFLYLSENPGRLDHHAVAARLSYLLTGSTPDAALSALADAGKLHDHATIRAEADRLLARDNGQTFVKDFSAQWLDLDLIDFTEPDQKLYPGFDAIVQHSMLNETHTFLTNMLAKNQSVSRLINADYTYLNSRLARFYGIKGVEGDTLQRVSLERDSHRGGVMTQGAIMKVTANGSNTSPVVRGVWVSERLLGVPIAPPPTSVPAIEPDIRGAKTIREQLEKHRSQAACAVCHVKIDPPGFALENFDPAGQWRDRYIMTDGKKRFTGPKIDAGYQMSDGRRFANLDEFRKLVAAEPRKLAANVAEKMLAYGTGAPISFADRKAVETIADEAGRESYGFRSILHAVVTSPVFLSK